MLVGPAFPSVFGEPVSKVTSGEKYKSTNAANFTQFSCGYNFMSARERSSHITKEHKALFLDTI